MKRLQVLCSDPIREKKESGHFEDPIGMVVRENQQLRQILMLLLQQKHGGKIELDTRDLIGVPWSTVLEIVDPDPAGFVRIVVR